MSERSAIEFDVLAPGQRFGRPATRRHRLLVVLTADGGAWSLSCGCRRWRRTGWCAGEGCWRIWIDFAVRDDGYLPGDEEYCSNPFRLPSMWVEELGSIGLIDTRPALVREDALIAAMGAER